MAVEEPISVLVGLTVNVTLAWLAVRAGGIDRPGATVGALLGTAIWLSSSWRGFLLFGLFYVVGTAATHIGMTTKRAAGKEQERGGRRGVGNALANAGVPALCSLVAVGSSNPEPFIWAFVVSISCALADTLESEIGMLAGRDPRLITTLERVPAGTDGAVSLAGTVAGLVGAVALSGVAFLVGLIPGAAIPAVALSALTATLLESLVGATLERRGVLDNNAVNVANTTFGALLGLLAWFLTGQ